MAVIEPSGKLGVLDYILQPGLYPEHDLFARLAKLKNTVRHIMNENLITHLGLDYYGEE